MRFMLIATVKNEGSAVLEWVAHHQRIGFTDIVVYQNDSTDFTQKSLRQLQKIGAIKYFDNSTPATRWQRRAYRRASLEPEFREVDYAITIDGDEFLHINTPEGTLPSLIDQVGAKDEIKLNWLIYGSAGHKTLSTDLITGRFTRTEDPAIVTRQMTGIKTLFRTDKFLRPGLHVPKEPFQEEWTRTNGSGLAEGEFQEQGWRCSDPGMRKYAQINHYMIRDAASFILKSARGSTGHEGREVKTTYWRKADRNDFEDARLGALSDDLRDRMEEMSARTRGKLMVLRERAVELKQAEFERLMKEEWAQELYRQITDPKHAWTPPTPAEEAAGAEAARAVKVA